MGGSPTTPQPFQPTAPEDYTSVLLDPTGGALTGAIAVGAWLKGLPCPDVPQPSNPTGTNAQLSADAFHTVYVALRGHGLWCWLSIVLAGLAATVVLFSEVAVGLFIWFCKVFGVEMLTIGLSYIDEFRKTLDPGVARVSVLVLNELMGTDLQPGDLPTGTDLPAHIARASAIGSKYINSITAEISPTADLESMKGIDGVSRFTGLIVNFGVATALLGLAGELASIGWIKNFRLVGEQVSSGLGLSKQMRIAIKPLLKTLVATPFQWYLNERYYPQRFTLADVVNPYQQTVMDHDTIVKDLELNGWSPDRAEALIKLHQKRLSVDEVETLRRWGHWSDDAAALYVQNLGWPSELVQTLLVLPELKRIDARMTKLVDALEQNVVDGHMTLDDFVAYIKTLPFTADEQGVILASVTAKLKSPHKSLTLAELQSAFDQGLITLDDVSTYLVGHGYTSTDEQILEALTLLKLAQNEEAIKVAQFVYNQKVATAQKKGTPVPPPPKILAAA